jgi:hypothetical protein
MEDARVEVGRGRNMPAKWLVATLAISLSVFANWAALSLEADEHFAFHLRHLRFVYYAVPVGMLAVSIYVVSIRIDRWLKGIVLPLFAAYLGSVIAYCLLAFLWLGQFPRAHPEYLLLAFIIPWHLYFVVPAAIASLSMRVILMAYKWAGRNT